MPANPIIPEQLFFSGGLQAERAPTMPEQCLWLDDGEAWTTQCGAYFEITYGTPEDNGMVFCHHCGRPIQVTETGDKTVALGAGK